MRRPDSLRLLLYYFHHRDWESNQVPSEFTTEDSIRARVGLIPQRTHEARGFLATSGYISIETSGRRQLISVVPVAKVTPERYQKVTDERYYPDGEGNVRALLKGNAAALLKGNARAESPINNMRAQNQTNTQDQEQGREGEVLARARDPHPGPIENVAHQEPRKPDIIDAITNARDATSEAYDRLAEYGRTKGVPLLGKDHQLFRDPDRLKSWRKFSEDDLRFAIDEMGREMAADGKKAAKMKKFASYLFDDLIAYASARVAKPITPAPSPRPPEPKFVPPTEEELRPILAKIHADLRMNGASDVR
jgi:hypothetical protein